MRSRSIIKETPSPNLCAFCAHRLGQARRPSHVQRRFLQSSRRLSRPPAEAAAQREDDLSVSAPASRRPTSTKSNGFGNTNPSWSRASFGRSNGPTGQPAGAWGRSNFNSNGLGLAPQAGAGNASVGNDGLLPHERRARELLLEKQKAAEEATRVGTPVKISTDAPRSKPYFEETEAAPRRRTHVERLEMGRKAWDKKSQLDSAQPKEHQASSGSRVAGATLSKGGSFRGFESFNRSKSRLIMDDKIEASSMARKDETPLPKWSQLRKRSETVKQAEETPVSAQKSNESIFAQGRAEREEESKLAKFTPLMPHRGITNPRYSEVNFRTTQDADPISKKGDDLIKQSVSASPDTTSNAKVLAPEAKVNQENEEDDEASSRPAREKKKKVRRGAQKELSYTDVPKGKDRDKAKRRQQFAVAEATAEEERISALDRVEQRRLRKLEKAARKAAPTPMLLPEYISVSNLAVALKARFEDFVGKMAELGFEETNHGHILNAENAGLIAMEYGFEPIIDRSDSEDLKAREPAKDPTSLPPRPPVVTIMGHVDHGKTTLLDYLRKSSVAATEHGGITQHIGAFSVAMSGGKVITFLDTPGHATFLSMRKRGANVTDIVILVIAADDSVKPQTIEAINHAKAAKVPIIVAINKIDKEDSNIDRVKQDLARHGVDVEDYGGDTQVVCVSGKTGQGMDELEEAAVTLSEILDMRAEKDGQAEGWVLEASVKSMGKVATVLVRRGTMRPGDFIVAGQTWARIRCLRNEAGVEIEEAGPGTPVEIDGWREQPLAGDEVLQAPDETKAKSVVEYRLENQERNKMAEDMEAINEFRKAEQEKRGREKAAEALEQGKTPVKEPVKPSGPKEVFMIIKGDVSGSVEAVIESVSAIGNQEVRPHILRHGVGQVSEFDIEHAATANGIVLSFNTTVEPHISRLAEDSKVKIIDHNIIYRLVDDVKAELSKYLPPLITQRVLGEAEIAQIFDITIKGRKQKPVAGCKVRNGTISKNEKVRVLRGGEKIYDGTIESLKNVKKDVQEMKKGTECGMGFDSWTGFQVGDQVQSYEQKEEKRYL